VPTGRMLDDLSTRLIERGHKVTALTSRGIYVNESEASTQSTNVGIKKVWTAGAQSRLVSWCLFWLQAVVLIPILKWDLCVILTDPPFLSFTARLAKWLHPSRKIYWWTMDLYPEALVAEGMITKDNVLESALRFINNTGIASMDGVIPLGYCQKKRLQTYSKWKTDSSFSLVVPPWDYRQLNSVEPKENRVIERFAWSYKKVALYAGNLGYGHTYTDLVEAARILSDEGDDGWIFAFFCRGARRDALKNATVYLSNVMVQDYVPNEETTDLLHAANVHLITMENGWEGIVVPSKLYGVLKTQAPVLFIGPVQADTAEEIRALDAGAILPNGCGGRAIVDALRSFEVHRPMDDMEERDGPNKIADFILK